MSNTLTESFALVIILAGAGVKADLVPLLPTSDADDFAEFVTLLSCTDTHEIRPDVFCTSWLASLG
jgi:hypothetical protein